MSGVEISLITVTYNSAVPLKRFWGAGLPGDIEWIVVDNASADSSVQLATDLGARVVALSSNLGFGAGNNVGAAIAGGRVLIFCNPDVEVDVDGVRRLASQVLRHGGLWAPQLLNLDGSLQENGRGVPTPARKLRHMLGRGANRDGYLRLALGGEAPEVIWVMGAAVAIGASTFRSLGGWDEKFFVYYEDSDLCIRARLQGEPTRIDGDVNWAHGWARDTRSRKSLRSWKFEIASGGKFYRRHWYCAVPVGSRGRALMQADRDTWPSTG